MALPPRDVKHVVITGASSGLGAAFARAYARPGVTLTLFGRDKVRLASVAATCSTDGADVSVIACDVTDAPLMTNQLIPCRSNPPHRYCNRQRRYWGKNGDGAI